MQTTSESTQSSYFSLEHTLAFLLLRIWLAVRALFSGLEKFSATVMVEKPLLDEFGKPDPSGFTLNVEQKVYGISHYHGMPEALADKFASEPFLPGFLMAPYQFLLGPLLILLGLTLLLGVATRFTLFAMGLLYVSLTFGLVLIGQDGGIAWLAAHTIMIAYALTMVRYNRWAIMKKY
jgi:thiosulfate dehydrogenase (quinone) large subunit